MKTNKIAKSEQFIVKLLEQDLMVRRLTDGLYNLGFETTEYELEITDMVCTLMSYTSEKEKEIFYDTYVNFLATIDTGRLKNRNFLHTCANELFRRLRSIKSSGITSLLNYPIKIMFIQCEEPHPKLVINK